MCESVVVPSDKNFCCKKYRVYHLLTYYEKVEIRDVIRSPDIRTFESRSEVRTQFQHPEVRIK